MVVDPLNVLQQLNEWRRDWNQARDRRVHPTLRLALDACQALVALEDVRSDAAVLLHERVKSLYHAVSSLLGVRLQPEDLEVVMKALASARMYYWLRFLNGSMSDELEQLIRRRSETYGSVPPSLGALDRAIAAIAPASALAASHLTDEQRFEILREGCLSDVAKLELVVVRYGASDA